MVRVVADGLLERERGFGSRGAVGSLTATSPTRDRVFSKQRRGAGLGRRRLVLAVAVVAAAVVLVNCAAALAALPAGQIETYPVPNAGSGEPAQITAGSDGSLWFTMKGGTGQLDRVTTSGSFTEFPTPTADPGPIVAGPSPDVNLWFGDEGNDKIGKSTTAGSITEFTVPPVMDESPEPTAITAGPGSALWFIEAYGGSDTIGEIPTTATVATPGIEQFTVPTAGAFATGIASGSDGNLWFTEQSANQIGKLTPAGTFSAYPLPDLDSFPAAITAGPDDDLWFTESDAIGEITTAGTITKFPLPSPTGGSGGADPSGAIAAGPDGNLWFAATVAGSATEWIGRMTPTGTFTYYALSGPAMTGPNVAGITAGPDGNMWFTEEDNDAIGVIGTASGGSTPLAEVSPTSIPFGAGTVGVTSGATQVSVTNTGGAALVLGDVQVTGASSGTFPITDDTCSGQTVDAGAGCTFDVAFDPPSKGDYSATVDVNDNASGSPQTIAVSGSAEPAASLSGTLDFPQLEPGQTSPTQSETVTNTGGAPLAISSVQIIGAQAGAFSTSDDTCSGAMLNPGGTCSVGVAFSPTTAGSYEATLQVSDDATGSPQSATVEGFSAEPVTVSPDGLSFGDITFDTTSAAQTVVVLDSGTAAVTVNHLTLTGAQPSNFGIVGDACTGVTLQPNDSCTVGVDFTPLTAGNDTASMSVVDTANTSPQPIALQGSSEPSVAVTDSVVFPSEPIGIESATQTLMVANTGHAPLDVSSAAIGGAQASAFAISADGCGGHAVAPGSSCSLQLTFTPPSSGSFNAALTLEDDALGAPQTVVLSGSGEMSTVTLTPSALGFGAVAGGSTSSPEDITVTDSGSGELTVDGATIGGAQPSAFRISDDGCAGLTISAGDSCTIAVEYQPPAGGTYAATLSIADDGTGSPQQVMLSGGASLTGTVDAAADGAPVAGASVIACQAPTCTSYVEATTAADGSYTIPRLAPGLWDVNVAPTGDANLSPGSAEVTIAANAGTVQNFGLIAPEPPTDGVTFNDTDGSTSGGVPVIPAGTPISFGVPLTLGGGQPNSTHTFVFAVSVGDAGATGSGDRSQAGAIMFSVLFGPDGQPEKMSPIITGPIDCTTTAQRSACGQIGGYQAGQVPARAGSSRDLSAAERQQPVATVADDCPPPATPVPSGHYSADKRERDPAEPSRKHAGPQPVGVRPRHEQR